MLWEDTNYDCRATGRSRYATKVPLIVAFCACDKSGGSGRAGIGPFIFFRRARTPSAPQILSVEICTKNKYIDGLTINQRKQQLIHLISSLGSVRCMDLRFCRRGFNTKFDKDEFNNSNGKSQTAWLYFAYYSVIARPQLAQTKWGDLQKNRAISWKFRSFVGRYTIRPYFLRYAEESLHFTAISQYNFYCLSTLCHFYTAQAFRNYLAIVKFNIPPLHSTLNDHFAYFIN